ncbi:MAG TPA: YcxB family protein [Anaerolineae bacterium]|nr:YcxB family protein [Anaerolineae bacterium]
MQIQFECTLDDYIAFHRYCFDNVSSIKRNYRIGLFGLALVLMTLGLLDFSRGRSVTGAIWFTAGLLWPVLYPMYYRRRLGQLAKHSLKASPNRGTLGPHTISISENELHETTDVNDSRWTWLGIERIEQDNQCIYIFVGTTQAHVISKRSFANDEEAVKFYNTAKKYFEKGRASNHPQDHAL